MNRIYSLLTLLGALACSSKNSESRALLPESTAGASNSPESVGNGGAHDPIESPRGAQALSDGGGSSFPDSELPGKRAPTHEAAQAVLDRLAALYEDYTAAADPPGTHRIVGRILDTDLTAHTNVSFAGQDWEIKVTAGWVALPKMTVDILTLSSCHELGHFVGGFPFKEHRTHLDDGTSIAAEEQADYFATKDCLPRVWADEVDSNAAAFAELDSSKRELCTKAHSDRKGQELCGRILITALQAAQIYKEETFKDAQKSKPVPEVVDPAPDPKLETPAPTVVTATNLDHADAQCRLDTMVAGILCDVKATGTTIPGYLPPYARFSAASQEAAKPFACQDGPGARPKCWFHPNTQGFDCTGFETLQCVIQDGQDGIRSCDPLAGLGYTSCMPNEVCLPDTDGSAVCVPAD